jgi:hypothetical protein
MDMKNTIKNIGTHRVIIVIHLRTSGIIQRVYLSVVLLVIDFIILFLLSNVSPSKLAHIHDVGARTSLRAGFVVGFVEFVGYDVTAVAVEDDQRGK